MEIYPWDRDPSLKWVQYPLGKVSVSVSISIPVENVVHNTRYLLGLESVWESVSVSVSVGGNEP